MRYPNLNEEKKLWRKGCKKVACLDEAGRGCLGGPVVASAVSIIKNCKLKIENLDKLSDGEVIKELTQVKGIGCWTAEMFLMFALGRPDIFPKDDLGINKAMQKLKLKNSNRWKPYRTVASWYLWRSLENR